MSSVGARGTVLLLLTIVVGGAAGWSYAEQRDQPRSSEAAPSPVAAADPAIPFTPPEKTKPDPELDPLTQTLATHDERLGTPRKGGVILPVPNGWVRTTFPDGRQATWRLPDGPAGGYTFRVQLLDENRTVSQKVGVRPAELRGDDLVSDLRVLGKSFDTLKASFIFQGYRRLTVIRWVSFGGGLVDLEIAATGRVIDETGLEALVAKIDQEVRLQPLPQKADQKSDQEADQKPGAAISSRTP